MDEEFGFHSRNRLAANRQRETCSYPNVLMRRLHQADDDPDIYHICTSCCNAKRKNSILNSYLRRIVWGRPFETESLRTWSLDQPKGIVL
jgi:hypothetical protein